MGRAYEHKCEQVLDPSYALNPSDPDKVAPFELQQQFMHSVFAKTLIEGKAANCSVSSDPGSQGSNTGHPCGRLLC